MKKTGSFSQFGFFVFILIAICLGISECYHKEKSLEDSQEFLEEPRFETEQSDVYKEDLERMRDLDEIIKYMVNDILFPIEGIVKGYCLYRSVSDELKNDLSLFKKESIVVATILLSGKWKNPVGFISRCRESLRMVSNGMKASSFKHSDESWSSIVSNRKTIKASRIKICFKAKICSRMMKKHDGIENLRRFLVSRTQYGLIYPDQNSEIVVWNTIREFKDILSVGILKGSMKNHIRVIVMFNYMNKILNQIGKQPVSLLACIALINAMVRERSLGEWLSFSRSKTSRNRQYESGIDPVTNLRYDTSLNIRENISNFQIRTCNHVIWTSGILLSERQVQVIGENSSQVYTLRKRVSWMCNKMFTM
ncbi:uncharacterized protein cubi_00859 [Cryptosporidium ubiquitum]|uniref:Uncharacterized protein n=1 Tax=Cryptosporidium ubiquitum TaxID=857276 RepID=A0A1J4MFV6_9CRYT|nr:uncharacterized protein cubi_00859 [Cryptosporidium ubiquitum]OII72887.1 hypothetical protein cubi_00859 [Cryptosporidium ubiquitum]